MWVKGKWMRKNAVEKLNLMMQVKLKTVCEQAVLYINMFKYEREIQGKAV